MRSLDLLLRWRNRWLELESSDELSRGENRGFLSLGPNGSAMVRRSMRRCLTEIIQKSREKYVGKDPKVGKRTPAWCDHILSFGKGMKLSSYKRCELSLYDHRPVTALYKIEVEVFSPRKLQKVLTFTNAEIVSPSLHEPKLLGTAE